MKKILYICLILFCSSPFSINAQQKSATLSGIITDEDGHPLSGVSVVILGRSSGILSSDSGDFQLKCPALRAFAVVFSHAGYESQQRNFYLKENEEERLSIRLSFDNSLLDPVTITEQRDRYEAGRISLDAKQAVNIPSPAGGVESIVKVFVGSNNELTSQYSVRGGNYDENLVYINDFEVFRPYLIRNGQQEGLSLINPEMAKNVVFYNGGFQSKYGDKMSSVLDIQYRRPRSFSGSAYAGFIEQGLHVEGVSRNGRFSFLTGIRHRNNRNVLKKQETQGNYVPESADLQALLTYQLNAKNSFELLMNFNRTRFNLVPKFSQLTASVFSPFFSANLGLDIYFDGREEDKYNTRMIGLSFSQQPTSKLRMKWMLGNFANDEKEGIDITGAYLFGEREFDKSKPEFGLINNPLGAGLYQTYARNKLFINVWNAAHKGSFDAGPHFIQWGQTVERQLVTDKLHEWEYLDSAGYNLPYNPQTIELSRFVHSAADLDVWRYSGYLQDNFVPVHLPGISIQGGVRYNYNSLNKELLISPRAGISWKPVRWRRDFVFRASAGAYHQPPFYREIRDATGMLNTSLKAQRSYQLVAGFDYQFISHNRPYRLTAEGYYKNMRNVVPYDIDNLRIRYTARNEARAYATGLELRLFGELVKDAESWISIGFMKTRENLDNDSYFNYSLDSLNRPTDSTLQMGGWFRRPTDRLFTFGMFLQDYLATNKNFKVYLNFLYGSNMPYNVPGSVKYRNGLVIDPYLRIDLGFSALLFNSEAKGKRRAPYTIKNIWAALEVFNLIDRDNTISYLIIKDFSNSRFAIPNRLTPRLLNVKVITRF